MDKIVLSIGRKLKDLRAAKGVTLAELAETSGMTKGYLSKIENGKNIPPIETLAKISAALDADIAYFFGRDPGGDNQDEKVSIVKAHERKSVVRGASSFGYDYEAVAYRKKNKSFEPFVFSFPENVEPNMPHFSHEGEEMLFILEGTVCMTIDNEDYIVSTGDCIYIDSTVPHKGRALNGPARALVVVYRDQKEKDEEST